jgi:phosphoglucosamine mutase
MFGTSGIRGRVGDAVTAGLALNVGRALGSTGRNHVVVGRDPRESGAMLADAISAGARECGATVTRLGVVATPTLARSVAWLGADVGIAVTASHNPPEDNGIKLWTPSGRAFDAEQRRRVRQTVLGEQFEFADWDETGREFEWEGATERHRERLVEASPRLEDLSVAVDVGNGTGGLTVAAFDALGVDVVTLNAQQDGRFPGRPSEPVAEHCTDLVQFVSGTDVDIGIAHDGDADRMRAVTDDGEFVAGDVLMAIFAREMVGTGDRVATPVDTSMVVDELVADRGGSTVRTRVGDVFVAETAAQEGFVFGGEQSGTWIWPDETLCPDAPFAACKLAAIVDRRGPLSELVADVDTYPIRRTAIRTDGKDDVMRAVESELRERYSLVDTTDGLRVQTEDGWFLVRPSGTEPLVRVTVECRSSEAVESLFEDVTGLVEAVVQRRASETTS